MVVIDDHQVMVESLAVALPRLGDIELVGSALTIVDGVSVVAAAQPDVVLLDYHLSDGTALDALPLLLGRAPNVRVIVLTALGADDVLAECLRAGAIGFVTKQQSINEVAAAVRAAAAGQVALAGDALLAAIPGLLQPAVASAGAAPQDALTARERDVLALLADGLPNREIAARMYLSVNTVRNHVAAILAKLGARTRGEATAIAHRRRLVPPPNGIDDR